jgi:hypothetical protein
MNLAHLSFVLIKIFSPGLSEFARTLEALVHIFWNTFDRLILKLGNFLINVSCLLLENLEKRWLFT